MSRQGFSLLELSIVLTIISIVVASGLSLGSAKTEQNRLINSYEEMKEIAEAISIYVNDNGCLPYPASKSALPGTATYGREPAANAECVTTGGSGVILEGAIPFYSLGLPDEYGVDDWNTRYTYAVVDTAVESTFSSSYTGAITVNDEGGTAITTEATYVIVSHGKNRKGGYNVKSGTAGPACSGTEKDGENCDADAVFVDAPLNDGSVAANFYDDLVVWKNTSSIYAYGGGGGGGGSSGYAVPANVILSSSTNNGNFGGYVVMDDWIDANGCPAASNYKICSSEDLVRYFHENGISASSGWVSSGNSQENCNGWKDGTAGANGTIWRGGSELFGADTCNVTYAVFCCQWN